MPFPQTDSPTNDSVPELERQIDKLTKVRLTYSAVHLPHSFFLSCLFKLHCVRISGLFCICKMLP